MPLQKCSLLLIRSPLGTKTLQMQWLALNKEGYCCASRPYLSSIGCWLEGQSRDNCWKQREYRGFLSKAEEGEGGRLVLFSQPLLIEASHPHQYHFTLAALQEKSKRKKNPTPLVQHALIAMCITHQRENLGSALCHDELHRLSCFKEKTCASRRR